MSESSEERGQRANRYEALIKPGDAVETPDGELWVVQQVAGETLFLASAYRDGEGRIRADLFEPTHTVVPADLATKIADARQVRR